MTAPTPLLVGEELEKEYRSGPEVVRVLRGASVVIRPGEVVALIGASGVGKSTLLHLLGALEETSGRDLAAWSTAWLETAGINILRPEIGTDTGEADGVITSFAVRQEAPARTLLGRQI